MIDCSNCHGCCLTKIPVLIDEKNKIRELEKEKWANPPQGKGKDYCRFLDKDGKCSIYENRPGICKYYGIVGNTKLQCHRLDKDAKRSQEFDDWAHARDRQGRKYL